MYYKTLFGLFHSVTVSILRLKDIKTFWSDYYGRNNSDLYVRIFRAGADR